MNDLRDYTGNFYFYIEGDDVYTRIKMKGMRTVDKMTHEEDEKVSEGLKKKIAKMLNVDIKQVKRVSKGEYIENTDEEDEE